VNIKNEKINSKIVVLWNKYFKDNGDVYAPMFYDDFKQGGLLFVGMNPSFSDRGFRTILRGTEYENIVPTSFLKWKNISSNLKLIDDCINIENYSYKNYKSYFARPVELAKEVGLDWQHIDIFLYKETSQTDFKKLITNGDTFNEFANEQISLFEEVLITINPKCIIVSNAFGSELLREHIKNDLVWDESRGFHWFTRGNKKIPIFFSSMLSGQRALDRWSYERLKWHIGEAVKVTDSTTK